MKKIILLFFFPLLTLAQVTISPSAFEVDDTITITVDANSTLTDCNGFNNPTKVYMHAGIGDDSNPWGFSVVGNWGEDDGVGEMTNNGDGTWSITINPKTYFNLTDTQADNATKIGMVFRNENGSQELKDNGCDDFFFDVGAFQLILSNPSENISIVTSGENFTITATTTLTATFTLTANGNVVDTQNNITNYSYTYSVTENTDFVLSATNGSDTDSAAFQALIPPTVTEAPVPAGMKDGINLDTADPTKATLVLYAPLKQFVHVIGDFNDWKIDNNYVMNKDSASDRFWIELTGLTPQFNHMYQYLVDYEINIADPYSTLIADPYTDQFIDAVTYPDLPSYPTGKTTEAVTVLRTGDPDYVWQTTNFQAPNKEDLVVYEILLRDFDELHSFDALKNRLDYLQELGINAIELMPVSEFDGNESWGYNPSFHMALDKYYGTKNAFKALIDECHARGIAVILDVVYNHATGQNPYFRLWNDSNGGLGGSATPDNPFFNQQATHSYSVFNDFNHSSQATRDYVKRTAQYWIEEFKIDGFRWDLTKGFTQNCTANDQSCTNNYQQDRVDVLKLYADYQWEINPDFYVIFEHLGGITEESEWAEYRVAEGKGILLWNKVTDPYNEATMGYHDNGKSNFAWAHYAVKGFNGPSAISYMESHDEERLMYKNLEFGNAANGYSVKDLNTALYRMQTAGAFFFTIPGPKMIWQFGELGYDISIDENGRTGNKPILWEYADNPNRKAIYNTWAKLINLKLTEPVFKTTDVSIDANDASGLKKIQLTYNAATGQELQYVTIIGNFGVTTQNIDPNFQITGTWYNILERNTPIEITNVNDPITLQPGEFMVLADKPVIDPNDTDSDGVENANDLCNNTPFGATVNVDGCEVFSLPANNYQISTISETCRNANNGQINITTQTALNYNVTVTGPNGFSDSGSFTTNWSVENLNAGAYTLCFTVSGEVGYEQCFTVSVTEPEDLSVYTKFSETSKSVSLTLNGSKTYYINLNGKVQQTNNSQLTLTLKPGLNTLEVSTDKLCQGVYNETIFVSNSVEVFPNPVSDNLNIYLAGNDSQVTVTIYTITGKLIYSKNKNVPANRLLQIPTQQLIGSQFIVTINGPTVKKSVTLLKK